MSHIVEYENLRKLNYLFEQELKKAFEKFLAKGWYILGEQTKTFEKAFAEFCGAKHCIGVASGLDALVLSLCSLELPAKSEVIVPSNTYIATILSVVNSGLKPILVEPDPKTCNISPKLIEAAVTARTKAVIAVHLYGKPCEIHSIQNVCEKHKLRLIEDCAQSHGAKYKGKTVGTFGDFGAFSFYPTKNLGALGDGGAIVTDNDALAEKLKAMRNYGSQKKYHNKYAGFNSRLDELQAAFLNIKLPYLKTINEHKRRLAEIYLSNIKHPDILLPDRNPDTYDVYHIFNIRLPNREGLRSFLSENGIGTEVHYPIPPNHQEGYQKWFQGLSYPVSERIHSTTLSLPISFSHKEDEILRVTEKINLFLRAKG